MATEQPSEKTNPPPEKKAPLPKVVKLNKALKLAQIWVDKMSAAEPDELNDKDFEASLRLGLLPVTAGGCSALRWAELPGLQQMDGSASATRCWSLSATNSSIKSSFYFVVT